MTLPADKQPGSLGIFLGLGASLAAYMTLGVLAGMWIDFKWSVTPWGVLSGSLMGISGCVYTIVRIVKKLE